MSTRQQTESGWAFRLGRCGSEQEANCAGVVAAASDLGTMVIRVECPNPRCGKRYKVEETLAGRSTICRYCGQQFRVPPSDNETAAPLNLSTQATAFPAAERGSRRPRVSEDARHDPEHIGRFRILARLGSGAFGTVYRAYDPVLDREVALKVAQTAVLEKPEAKARFLREPKAAAQLQHPHIVPVFDAGSDGTDHYIASAYIDGQTLEAEIKGSRLDFRRAAALTRDLADALAYAHSRGVVHRDVKPGNIMIDNRGDGLLTDFGLAHLESSGEKLTHDGSVMGTPAYMAPEQVDRSFGEVGAASDQYALGVVCYEMLCGETPFRGPPAVQLFNVVHRLPPPPRSKNRGIPKDLETICLKAIAKRPRDRYPDAAALAEDLRRWLDDEPIRARRMGPLERTARWARRNPIVAPLVAAVVIVTLVGLAAVTWQWGRAEVHRFRAERALVESKRQAEEAERQQRIALDNAERARRQEKLATERKQEAEENLIKAEQAGEQLRLERDRARNAEKAAKEAEREAVDARERLQGALDDAEQQRQRAEKAARTVRRQLYALEMNLAMQAFEAMNWERVGQLLRDQVPEPTQEDLRTFEWYYLAGQFGVGGQARAGARTDMLRHSEAVYRLEFLADGKTLVAFANDVSVKIWDVGGAPRQLGAYAVPAEIAEGEKVEPPPAPYTPRFDPIVVSPDGRRVALAPASAQGVQLHDFATHQDTVCQEDRPWMLCSGPAAFAPDGQTLAAVRAVDEMTLVRVLGPQAKANVDRKLREAAQEGRLPPNEFFVAKMLDDEMRGLITRELTALGLKSTGDAIWTSRKIGEPRLWPSLSVYDTYGKRVKGLDCGQPISLSPNDGRGFHSLCVSAKSGLLAALYRQRLDAGGRGTSASAAVISLWHVASGELRLTYPMPSLGPDEPFELSRCDRLDFTPDGKRLVMLSLRRPPGRASLVEPRVFVWDAESPAEPVRFDGPVGCSSIAFSPDGTTAALWRGLTYRSSQQDWREPEVGKDVTLWDLDTGKAIAVLSGHKFVVRSVAFAPDGRTVATASEDKTIKLWDLEAARERVTFHGGNAKALSVAFSPDGTMLASGNTDGVVRLYRAEISPAIALQDPLAMPDPQFLILPEIGLHVEMAEKATPDEGRPGSVRVLDVAADTPARRAAFQSGDVIVSINQQWVQSLQEFRALVQGPDAAAELNVLVDRNGEKKSLLLILDRGPSDAGLTPDPDKTDAKPEDR